jgi:nitrite reductase/ring-hydroxylating ferredoxin subunit
VCRTAPGDHVLTTVGETPVIVTRGRDGDVNVLVNRCAHRGVTRCETAGTAPGRHFTCRYHQWRFGLDGTLVGLPFRKGVNGNGGMPGDFEPAANGLARLRVARRNGVVFATRSPAATAEIGSLRRGLRLADARLLDPVAEFPGIATVVMQTLWPNLILQQQSNTLATRQLVVRGPGAFDLHWTFFGYADDDEAMRTRRLRPANLMGPAGLVSVDDSEVLALAQRGRRRSRSL